MKTLGLSGERGFFPKFDAAPFAYTTELTTRTKVPDPLFWRAEPAPVEQLHRQIQEPGLPPPNVFGTQQAFVTPDFPPAFQVVPQHQLLWGPPRR